ncbi:MAG: SMI1/KNR4 family protein [Candidatus Pacearchaeota archaeon]|nr:SMI1/KNR4 family protein [Candidatus Pacearchaeota archaeon]
MNKEIKFDIEERKIMGNKKNIEYLTRVAQNILKKNFSPSFIEWLKRYGEEVYINKGSGNFNTNKLLPKNKKEEIISMTYGSKAMKEAGWPINNDFIPFGSDGGENIFVFYTKFSKNGEYPVLMVSLDDEKCPYVFMGSSFENFVNTYVKLEILRANLDEKELLKTTKEAIKKYEPSLGMEFAIQLVNWEWKFKSIVDIDRILKKGGFKGGVF